MRRGLGNSVWEELVSDELLLLRSGYCSLLRRLLVLLRRILLSLCRLGRCGVLRTGCGENG